LVVVAEVEEVEGVVKASAWVVAPLEGEQEEHLSRDSADSSTAQSAD
jgi:hypothetical protein